MEIFDDSWVNEYESLEKNYDIFYKETLYKNETDLLDPKCKTFLNICR